MTTMTIEPDEDLPSVERRVSTRRSALGPIVIIAVLVASVIGWRLSTNDSDAARPLDTIPAHADVEATYGVRFVRVDLLAEGGLVELRYQTIDPAKSTVFHDVDGAHLPFLVDESTGRKITETQFHSHSMDETPGRTYSILYGNAGGALEPGSSVTINVGDLQIEHVRVD